MKKNFWDKMATNYEKNTNRIYEKANKKVIEYTTGYCNMKTSLLDVGCGTGQLTRALAKHVDRVDAIDSSLEMLEIARNNSEKENLKNISWYNKNLIDNDSIGSSYNLITAFNLLLYIENPETLIANIYDNLYDEGYFISVTDCLGERINWLNKMQLFLSRCGVLPYIHAFKEKDLIHMLVNSGFEIELAENVHTMPSNYYIVARKIKAEVAIK